MLATTYLGMQAANSLGDPFTEGACAAGADFLCGPRDGIFSCRPCDDPQLAAFKELQALINGALGSRGLAARIRQLPKARSAIDGRIGASTAAALGALASAIEAEFPPPPSIAGALGLAKSASSSEGTAREIAKAAPDIAAWLRAANIVLGAEPSSPGPSAGIGPTGRKGMGKAAAFGLLAGLVGLGFVGAGVYSSRHKSGRWY